VLLCAQGAPSFWPSRELGLRARSSVFSGLGSRRSRSVRAQLFGRPVVISAFWQPVLGSSSCIGVALRALGGFAERRSFFSSSGLLPLVHRGAFVPWAVQGSLALELGVKYAPSSSC
jgi:hypothetical protein